jgi:hypothetical protein
MVAALSVSERTVERHLEDTYRKIAARNRADATAYALRHLCWPITPSGAIPGPRREKRARVAARTG